MIAGYHARSTTPNGFANPTSEQEGHTEVVKTGSAKTCIRSFVANGGPAMSAGALIARDCTQKS